jgi:hypothetical protein
MGSRKRYIQEIESYKYSVVFIVLRTNILFIVRIDDLQKLKIN